MMLQQEISSRNNLAFMDRELKALIDEIDPQDPEQFTARSQMDAPEVDGVIYVRGKQLKVGNFANVRVTGAMEYDLIGEAV